MSQPSLETSVEAGHDVPASEARDHFSDLVNAAAYAGYVTRRGRRLAAIVPAEAAESVEAEEDATDIAAADSAVAEMEAGTPTVPWDDAKKRFGL